MSATPETTQLLGAQAGSERWIKRGGTRGWPASAAWIPSSSGVRLRNVSLQSATFEVAMKRQRPSVSWQGQNPG